jgi:CIC family chloride channel protein
MRQWWSEQVAGLRRWWSRQNSLLPIIFADATPLDLRFVGRMLLHTALVGLAAGILGAAFFAGLEYVQRLLLEDLAGYKLLRAHGEQFAGDPTPTKFRPWLLLILPAVGGLLCGLVTRLAPETRGGGGDAMINAFHHQRGQVRRRVIWVKGVASLCTLGTGGSGGREGPTMHIGAALGSTIGRMLRVSTRERRILLIAGVAAGIAAVFRTPLGAALLAVEVLYRDGYESDALIPAVFASVISYSVIISIFGESTLFAHPGRFPFEPLHLPFYAVLALFIAILATGFVAMLRHSRAVAAKLPVPDWLRPATGGLAIGLVCTPLIMWLSYEIGAEGQGLGLLGGGYGAVQMAITGAAWLKDGWVAVEILVLLALAKLVVSSITIGSGGSAGDFAPSLVIGGVFGGAFGRAVQILFDIPELDPGAFALVGMGAFYGGIAHVPLAALVLVCEMAGNYDLLVPLMMALGISYVLLRKVSLYEAQVPTQSDSPVHRDARLLYTLQITPVKDVMTRPAEFAKFLPQTSASQVLHALGEATWQTVFPVVDGDGRLIGLIGGDVSRIVAILQDASHVVAADFMAPAVLVRPDDDLLRASEALLANHLRELPIVDHEDRVVGFLDEHEITRVYLKSEARPDTRPPTRR